MWLDLAVSDLESLSREELIALARRQDAQITLLATRLADVSERLEQALKRLAELEYLLSRNSGNSSVPPSKDDGLGRTPPCKERRAKPSGRAKGKQPGAPGTALRWREEDELDDRQDRYPEGACGCGADLGAAADLGVVDRYQQHEIPLVSVSVVQYDQHAVACGGCGRVHTAARPEGAGAGRVEYGPNLRAYAVYLLVVHFVPVRRVVDILTSLTGARPSVGFVHSLLRRAARALQACDFAIRTLITLAFTVCADETPLKVGPATPAEGKKEAKGYLHVACTELYTHFLLGDRSMKTFRQTILQDLEPGAIAVHDRYQAYDSTQLGDLNHQLCLAHVLRDLTSAAQLYPDEHWPVQLADELRELIHRASQARTRGETSLPQRIKSIAVRGLRAAIRIGLAATAHLDDARPGARKSRLLLEAFHQREDDFLRFTTDLRIPPTSNQAERDLRPSKIQENISGRLTHPGRAKDRYLIHGVLSTAVKHTVNPLTVLRDAFTGTTWLPPAARA
ncbi:IS66 family transposase [Streptomyces sp. 900105245]